MLNKKKLVKSKAALFMAMSICIGAGGLTVNASPVAQAQVQGALAAAVKDITIIEVSEKTGMPKIIEWNGKQYRVDGQGDMFKSTDQGAVWHKFRADYDTMKHLYSGFDMEMVTYEEHMEMISSIQYRVDNPRPEDNADFVSTLAYYKSILPAWEKGEAIEDISLLVKQKSFEFNMPGKPGDMGEGTAHAMFGNTLGDLYGMLKEQLAHWVKLNMLDQSQADGIWQDFLYQYNLVD